MLRALCNSNAWSQPWGDHSSPDSLIIEILSSRSESINPKLFLPAPIKKFDLIWIGSDDLINFVITNSTGMSMEHFLSTQWNPHWLNKVLQYLLVSHSGIAIASLPYFLIPSSVHDILVTLCRAVTKCQSQTTLAKKGLFGPMTLEEFRSITVGMA